MVNLRDFYFCNPKLIKKTGFSNHPFPFCYLLIRGNPANQSSFILSKNMITKGIAFILFATFAFALMNALAKELSPFPAMEVVFFRAMGTFVFIFPYMLRQKISVKGKNVGLLLLRGTVGFISLATFFMAVQRIPLGSAISIRYLGPVFGTIMAYFFLKEKVNLLQWLSFVVAISGVLLLKGFDVRIDLYNLTLVLISAISVGMVFTLLRFLGTREHHLTIINYFMVINLVGSLFFAHHWRMPVAAEWWPVVGIGIFGLVGQVFMTKAFQLEKTSVLAPFKYMELVYALLLGFIFFGETYQWLPFLGILLIILGMLMNVYGKEKGEAPGSLLSDISRKS